MIRSVIDLSKIHDSKNLPHPNPHPQAEEGTVFTPSLARVACGGGLACPELVEGGWGQEIVANYGNVNNFRGLAIVVVVLAASRMPQDSAPALKEFERFPVRRKRETIDCASRSYPAILVH